MVITFTDEEAGVRFEHINLLQVTAELHQLKQYRIHISTVEIEITHVPFYFFTLVPYVDVNMDMV